MRRILIVATTSYAGMGPYVTSIFNAFKPEDEVYFLGREYVEEFFRKNIREDLIPKCTFYKKANTHWNTLVGLFLPDNKFENLLLEICVKHNIEVVHYINRPVSVSLINKLHKSGIKTLGTVHDLHPHEANKVWYKMFRHYMVGKILSDEINASDNLLTNSPVQLNELREEFSEKNSVYASFPSLVTEKIISGTIVPEELKQCEKPYILFFGLIEEYKGIDILMKAFSTSGAIKEKYNLVIAGRGTLKGEWLRQKENGVHFINRFIKDEEVRGLYENAAMVVYPYISATQSGVLSLAYYFGTPTIVSDVPFFKSIVEPVGAGLVFKAGNSEALADCIMKIESMKDSIVSAEKDYYSRNYDIVSLRNRLVEIYNTI